MRRAKYPFDTVVAGRSIVVPAEASAEFARIRVAACTFGKRKNVKLNCRQQADGSLLISYERSTAVVATDHPSQFEYISYLASMQQGQSFTLGFDYKDRFEQLTIWTKEYAAGVQASFLTELTTEGMRVTKCRS